MVLFIDTTWACIGTTYKLCWWVNFWCISQKAKFLSFQPNFISISFNILPSTHFAELSSSSTAVFHEPVTLTCEVQTNLTDYIPQVSWFFKINSDSEPQLLLSETQSVTNSTSFEHVLSKDSQTGKYYCSVNDTISNEISIYFRSLLMTQLPDSAAVYKNQQVEIKVIQKGDIGTPHVECSSGEISLGHSIVDNGEGYLEARIKFKPDKTSVVVCEATFSDDAYILEANTTVEVLGMLLRFFPQFKKSTSLEHPYCLIVTFQLLPTLFFSCSHSHPKSRNKHP